LSFSKPEFKNTRMDNAASLAQQIEELTQPCYKSTNHQACQASLDGLVQLYSTLPDQTGEAAKQVRQAFLQVLARFSPEQMDAAAHQRLAYFLAEQVEMEDFADQHWQTPDEVVAYCEMLYAFKVEDPAHAERIDAQAHHLLTQALLEFEQRGDIEKLFTLFHLAPTTSGFDDREHHRLRSRVYTYEMRRVRRHRRLLYSYLIVQVLLITIVFPLLFINAENGAIQDQIEAATDVELPEEARRYFTYGDGLYWALITAASIGYGDITPQTHVGRIIAAILGVMGVITVGVIAGLILDWISPRTVD
jgi:hypothetical protein